MTLQEAVKSGKKFKRAGQINYYEEGNISSLLLQCALSSSDIFADDWMIEEKVYTFTESRLHYLIEGFFCDNRYELRDYYGNTQKTENSVENLKRYLKENK